MSNMSTQAFQIMTYVQQVIRALLYRKSEMYD